MLLYNLLLQQSKRGRIFVWSISKKYEGNRNDSQVLKKEKKKNHFRTRLGRWEWVVGLSKDKQNVSLTSKYGLHAERTTLWALRVFPSAASVQSTSVPLSRSVSKFCMSVLWWLFHLRQNCWSSSMVLASFPRFCTDEKTSVVKQRSITTDERPDNEPTELSLARSVSPYRAINRPNDPTLSRPPTTDYYRAHRARRCTRVSTFLNFCQPIRQCHVLFSSVSFSFFFLSRTRALAGGRRSRKLRNEAPKLPKWPCERCVGRIALLAFSFVRVW